MCCLFFAYFQKLMGWIRKLPYKCCCMLFKCLSCPFRYILQNSMGCLGFIGGCALGYLYYEYLLIKITLPYYIELGLAIGLSLFLGLANAVCRQMRCISLLTLPMYCGKPGRRVLKAVVLTYVIAGPITNMGLNAKEVVRVFACSTQLAQNLSTMDYVMMAKPLKDSVVNLKNDMSEMKDALRSFRKIVAPIKADIEDVDEIQLGRRLNDYVDMQYSSELRCAGIDTKYTIQLNDTEAQIHQKRYSKKVEYRCHDQLSLAVQACADNFKGAYERCASNLPMYAARRICLPLKLKYMCNLMPMIAGPYVCDSENHVNPGIGESYVHLLNAESEISDLKDFKLQYKVNEVRELYNYQDATKTGALVMQAFEEKHKIMEKVIMAVNICVAILFFRILIAAATYHDTYLTSIRHDNVYITEYFKEIDRRRQKKHEHSLLPLKKMERSKYVDIHSLAFTAARNTLFNQVLKVLLEMVTATTFVMLDRLFFEALDVVTQHAYTQFDHKQDYQIQVKGDGLFANLVRTVLSNLNHTAIKRSVTNKHCLPHPRSMPPIFYLKIYGGYLWILLLLYINPYTVRLRRLICSWFYPKREKQRILHLYNDILKKRLKMKKTLRRKAVQSVRAYYLSGENLLSLRLKFPRLLEWLSVFPDARKTCLICGETEPRNRQYIPNGDAWHNCTVAKCPFIFCDECWRDIDQRCLACDPSLAELSDVDSLSEDEQPRY